jgi:signal recognition particle GTPase
MENKPKEEPESKEDWETEFINKFHNSGKYPLEELKFIHSEKKKSREELLTELEEKLPKDEIIMTNADSIGIDGWKNGFNSCLKQIRSIINKLK